MSRLTRILALSIAVSLLGLFGAARTPLAQRPSLLVYDFDLDLGPVGNIEEVRSLGFDGLVTRVGQDTDVRKLEEYARFAQTIDGFELLAFVPYDFSNPASPRVWRDALPILARMDAPLWVIVRGLPSEAAVRALLLEMAHESEAFGVTTVIYPHWNTNIESAAEADALIRSIGHPNLKNSLHTCHEIRSGNQRRLKTVAAKYTTGSSLVTIAGADPNAYAGPVVPGVSWSDAIQPLAKDGFSLLPFLQGLHDAGYDGPVILHTFGIGGGTDHLRRSLRKYGEYVSRVKP